MQHIIRGFARANLVLDEAPAPFAQGPAAAEVFGLTITSRGRRRTQIFQLWPGKARLAVLGPDRSWRQAVLFVEEPEITFEEPVYKRSRLLLHPPPGRVLRETRTLWWMERVTPAHKRWYLCGEDERHLFISELPGHAATVGAAHRLLKSEPVRDAEGRSQDVVRQGEWFFLETTRAERDALDILSRAGHTWRGVRIGSRGNPHVADELAVVRTDAGPLRQGERYVRGRVRHAEHRPVRFSFWRRVERNAEEVANERVSGWID